MAGEKRDRKGIGDFPTVDPTEEITGKGLGVLLAFFAVFIVLFALSYPLHRLAEKAWLGAPADLQHIENPSTIVLFSLCFLALAITGIVLTYLYRRHFALGDLIAPLFLAALVWLAIQAQYWYNGWTAAIPYYPPTFNAAEVFFITLGAVALLKSHPVLRFGLAGNDLTAAAGGLGLGVVLGIPFAVLNAMFFVFIDGKAIAAQDVITEAIVALKPAIMEEAAFRLLFMGLAIVVLLKVLPRNIAIVSAVFMAIVFHSVAHVPDLLLKNASMAVANVIVTSLLFGLPMASLAYKKGIETAIGFHWVIDAVRFALGL